VKPDFNVQFRKGFLPRSKLRSMIR
jgi:hypothetical protein